jgi:hypothetical protein
MYVCMYVVARRGGGGGGYQNTSIRRIQVQGKASSHAVWYGRRVDKQTVHTICGADIVAPNPTVCKQVFNGVFTYCP